MITREPIVRVGIVENIPEVQGVFHGKFAVANVIGLSGAFTVRAERGTLVFTKSDGQQVLSPNDLLCQPLEQTTFLLKDVKIGIGFHWEQREDETFEGSLRFLANNEGMITVINEIPLEAYLRSVISSEMSAEAPLELLRAHGIVSRSWLAALKQRREDQKGPHAVSQTGMQTGDEVIRWYGHEDHTAFDVCADDHCQRYQGVTKIISDVARKAIESTCGLFLVHDGRICDARYSKSCGGLTEDFQNVWDDAPIPYLRSIPDSPVRHKAVHNETEARRWIESSPDAYCNTSDENVLRTVLPSIDQVTKDFFRWNVEYAKEELEEILRAKSGMDFGTLMDLVPLSRGPSGRIYRLKIVGSARTLTVGKELEIRKWLSRTHLYSSAFTVDVVRNSEGIPTKFVLTGAGWGHGVGMCQIGAAVMATKGIPAEEIAKHYFHGAVLEKLY